MSEKPILFSGEMVRAILEGRKTQTRRVMNPQPVNPNFSGKLDHIDSASWKRYGRIGDRLWVRETFRELIDLGAGTDSSSNYYEYKADGLPDYNPDVKWKLSIFMPREASRITLEIVSVRVERLQDIGGGDVQSEGVSLTMQTDPYDDSEWLRNQYRQLWDKLNKERGYGWDVNPWVWVIEFKQVKP